MRLVSSLFLILTPKPYGQKKRDLMQKLFLSIFLLLLPALASADDGSGLWLPRETSGSGQVLTKRHTPTAGIAVRELEASWRGVPVELKLKAEKGLSPEGFSLKVSKDRITITSPSDAGLLYGAYHLLREQGLGHDVSHDSTCVNPAYSLRILNHWDNLDGTVERGYAGESLWDWAELPEVGTDRYEAYARANASIGINATVLNNVNASPMILSSDYLKKVKALADIFRPYNIRVFLSVNFASPMALDSLPTADPLDNGVRRWWKDKAKEIYSIIPDFGGFLVKANSEGQPGPCDFGRSHAEGANMLADALRPYGGTVIWRAFVYSPSDADRAKQAYLEFQPLDGEFLDNVMVQIKNGPIDFQPREPYSPLFTSMPRTPLVAELQITQEYLGHSNHVVFLAPMWKEFLSYVEPSSLKAIAGVANIGTDADWCGNVMAQGNWYAFGRLAWDPSLSSETLAREWAVLTLKRDNTTPAAIETVAEIMLRSREAAVDYMMPLGLHHLFAWGHHYGPEPWCDIEGAREDWMPRYYHKADSVGIGFDRSSAGSGATMQYPATLAQKYDDIGTCPEEYLLWFHHVPWTHFMKSGDTLWEELCHKYSHGVDEVREFQKLWDSLEGEIDGEQFLEVQRLLKVQARDAIWWKDACLLYFQQFSRLPFPTDVERPIHNLDDLMKVHLPITNFECPSQEMLDKNR